MCEVNTTFNFVRTGMALSSSDVRKRIREPFPRGRGENVTRFVEWDGKKKTIVGEIIIVVVIIFAARITTRDFMRERLVSRTRSP